MITILPPVYDRLRLTVPALEAIITADRSNIVAADVEHSGAAARLWAVRLVRPPRGLVVAQLVGDDTAHTALRLEIEPPYPGEYEPAWWTRGEWCPCPTCGRALVWWEAGYVPAYRICLAGHHAMLTRDGRAARPRWRS